MDGLPPLTPGDRALDAEPAGTPVALADGAEWTLAGYMPNPGPTWDDLYDQAQLRGRYALPLVQTAALRLLRANYLLTPEEGFALIAGADPDALARAVEAAMVGPERARRGYCEWVELTILSAGLRLEDVPRRLRRPLVDYLTEGGGRPIPAAAWVSSAEAAAKKAAHLRIGKGPA